MRARRLPGTPRHIQRIQIQARKTSTLLRRSGFMGIPGVVTFVVTGSL